MASQKDEVSETGEAEDLPSDFFDDFSKDEFMEGLSVVDECWEDNSGPGTQRRDSRIRIDAEVVDSVNDLRELIGESNEENKKGKGRRQKKMKYRVIPDSKYKWHNPETPEESKLNSFTKPGSRRDPNKTNEAIKKDKEVKVQQFLAKSLESTDLRPPGTELDDYYEDEKSKDIRKELDQGPLPKEARTTTEHSRSPRHERRRSPRPNYSSRESPRRANRKPSPLYSSHSDHLKNVSPIKKFRRNYSPTRRSPIRRSPGRRRSVRRSPEKRRSMGRRSPGRYSPHRHSPRRYSPRRRSPRQYHRSRSPQRPHRSRSPQRPHRLRQSRSPRSRSPHHNDNFLYPNNPDTSSGYLLTNPLYQPDLGQQFAPQINSEYPGNPGYYQQGPAYAGVFSDPYNYGVPQLPPSTPAIMPTFNPVPAPVTLNPVSAPVTLNPVSAPLMVPAPTAPAIEKASPYDALAQLVTEGKISREDYLKLTPNKGVATTMDTKTRVMVLTRCNQALGKLDKLLLPNRLMINKANGVEDKCLAPKYCSPLKRQAFTEFSFTKGSVSPAHRTKQLVESIVSTLGLDKMVSKYKKKLPKNTRDAVIQTTKPHCEVCEIREATKVHDVGTSTEPEYFTSTVHTQVVEQDLVSSKSIFNPTGSIGEGANISIAHLTPAQLVSQLAARAKTLKQPQAQEADPPSSQFSRRMPPNYDYDSRGGQYHNPYNNYRY